MLFLHGPLHMLSSLGHPNKFQRVLRFGFVTAAMQRRRSTEVNQTLHDVRPFAGLVLYILGALVPNGILLGAKFTLLFIPFSKTLEQRFLQIAELVNMGNHPQNTVEFPYAY